MVLFNIQKREREWERESKVVCVWVREMRERWERDEREMRERWERDERDIRERDERDIRERSER